MQFTEHRIEAKFTTRAPNSIIRAVLNGAVKTVKIRLIQGYLELWSNKCVLLKILLKIQG